MAQPEMAAGDANIPVDAPATETNDPIEALVDEFLGDEEEEPATDGDEPDGADYDAEDEPDEADEAAAIAPPVSWTAEEKEKFKDLPRDLQETLARREGERERFVQTKAQEAAHARSQAEREALAQLGQLQATYARQLQHYASQFEVQEPDPELIVEDPEAYAYQLRQYRHATAQRQQAQRQAEYAQLQAAQAQQAVQAQEAQMFQAVLQQNFPEFLEPNNAKLREELGSIAMALGYPPEQLNEADATDILAMREVAKMKAKADKYDALMGRKMENVRAAKSLPKVARPGAAAPRSQSSTSRREAAWERVKANRDPKAFADFLGL